MKFFNAMMALGILASISAAQAATTIQFDQVSLNETILEQQTAQVILDMENSQVQFLVFKDKTNKILSEKINARLLRAQDDGCGTKIYTARMAPRGFDDFSGKVQIIDNSARTCENVLEALYVVNAEKSGGFAGVSYKYHATGNAKAK